MGVFPAASKKHLPVTWQRLMCDPVSLGRGVFHLWLIALVKFINVWMTAKKINCLFHSFSFLNKIIFEPMYHLWNSDKLICIFHFRNLPLLIFILLILKLISMAKSMLGKVSRIDFFILFFTCNTCSWNMTTVLHYEIASSLTVTWSIVGVALLPFVDEKRLLSALEKVYPDLTDEECE